MDQHTLTQLIDTAEAILWNDGVEEYPAELVDFAKQAIGVPESQQPDPRIFKAATHAAFGAMLLGLSIREAVNLVIANRGDILEEAVNCDNRKCPQNDGGTCFPGHDNCTNRTRDLCAENRCDECRDRCPDERAKRNIIICYLAVTNGNCLSNCDACPYGERRREP
jgi:hypothetical protein